MKIIELSNVSKAFKGQLLFNDVNLTIEKGRIYGLVGPNGSGKSVLFKMICGFIKPDQGQIIIHSDYRRKGTDFPHQFGVIIDRPGYIGNISGFENLKRWASILNLVKDEQIKDTMRLVGLNPDTPQKVRNYSLGMKQKLAFAQAIMEDQEVLILDESFNALDADSVINTRKLLLSYKQEGKTILLTSHNREDIDILCDDVIQITNQRLERLVNVGD
ncbi:multidrug ABC transporter ATP-binding protein [Paenibacillus sp. FSL H7-0326]|uniref:ABC transporter ATP-binding protein n=1 Tax=Paenibacillus sp. FSL H7-0326 TaxID=1921144 RepID=UPI00096F0607|nr:ATP-binding cassette domain-containing protein [Paenibacillus sp. FSL H7-0326]OMC71564.1 multidrug ABC transporter ATP-binding protein [Paenibacillus sp. FSL H7-0326]